jgi:glycosyltransferase involved in cell wall biosynthesis
VSGLKVSILIPTYNQPQYIVQAVESALSQDYKKLEVIVNDDSTNDETEKLLAIFKSDPRFTYYKTVVNIGRVANYRQLLYEYATGDWVVMLDGDDYYIQSNYISKAVVFISENPALVLVGASHKIFYEKKNENVDAVLVENDVVFDGKKIFTDHIAIPQHTTNIYKRSIAVTLNLYSHPSNASDAEGLYRLCLHGDVAYLKTIPVVWRIHGDNTTFSKDISKQLKELNFIDSVYNYSLAFLQKDVAQKWRQNQYFGHSHHILDLAFHSKKLINVIKVCYFFRKYWGGRSVLQVINRYLNTNSKELPLMQKIVYNSLRVTKKLLKKNEL